VRTGDPRSHGPDRRRAPGAHRRELPGAARDRWRCAELYEAAGIDLGAEPLVGLGTVCRRQQTIMVGALVATLAADGLRLHGFGFKRTGLRDAAPHLASADSLAWSLNARRNRPLAGCEHASCANCLAYALAWRGETLEQIERAGRPS